VSVVVGLLAATSFRICDGTTPCDASAASMVRRARLSAMARGAPAMGRMMLSGRMVAKILRAKRPGLTVGEAG
jgi:hypothetical protein